MSTNYSEIYTFFMRKIEDYDLSNLLEAEVEEILEGYLISSTTKFKKCKKDLTNRDEINKLFNETLDEEEIEILSILMLQQWLYPRIYTSNILKQEMSPKDFKMYSQANHIKEVQELYKESKKEAAQLMMNYFYNNWDLSDLQ